MDFIVACGYEAPACYSRTLSGLRSIFARFTLFHPKKARRYETTSAVVGVKSRCNR